MDEIEQELERTSKKKRKMVLKVPFEMNIKKTTRKRSYIKLLEDWIDKERIKKQIVVRNKDIIDKNEDFPNLIDL